MKTLRALLVAFVAAVASLSPMAASRAEAGTPQNKQTSHSPRHAGQQRIYWVYYRSCPDSPWVCYGGYYQADQAIQAVTYFRYQGYDSFYR
jgi:hypothetical protein